MLDKKITEEDGHRMAYGLIGLRTMMLKGEYMSLDSNEQSLIYNATSTFLEEIGTPHGQAPRALEPGYCDRAVNKLAYTLDVMDLMMMHGQGTIQAADRENYSVPLSPEHPLELFGMRIEDGEGAAALCRGCRDALKPLDLAYGLEELRQKPDQEQDEALMGFYPFMTTGVADTAAKAVELVGHDRNVYELAREALSEGKLGITRQERLADGAKRICNAAYGKDPGSYGSPEHLAGMIAKVQSLALGHNQDRLSKIAKEAAVQARLEHTGAEAGMTAPEKAEGPRLA